ncbi:hypothetical protein QL285_036023 [Trifolium repens]|jgi:ABC-type Fe3+/spermidine/putrescine transport system ATPase subunit|nr:hypothetical protein QL285_036023 [Trifolium repens]
MTDRGYYNFYTPDEYNPYQQCSYQNYEENPYYYSPEPYRPPSMEGNRLENTLIKFMEMQQEIIQQQQQQMQQMQQESKQYQEKNNAALKNFENQLAQMAQQMADKQSVDAQTTTQTTTEDRDNEECGESVEVVVGTSEKECIPEGCGVIKVVKETETPHEEGIPQEIPCIEKGNTVDNEKMVMDAEVIKGLFDKEESCEQKKETKNKAEIDRVINEICALFDKKQLGRTWTPNYLYFKFMEFLPNQRKKTDDVLSVSFWPP